MGKVGQNEGNPCQKEIPDQAHVAGGIGVSHPRPDQENTSQAGQVEKNEDGNIMPIAVGKIFDLI